MSPGNQNVDIVRAYQQSLSNSIRILTMVPVEPTEFEKLLESLSTEDRDFLMREWKRGEKRA